ncbi:TetR/AcrR family transcriptional regulator C-terminal ligand-binding domain-containing protein [Streptomyces sp. NPDC008121]|uniref:TetR/AcrR family transcriptional regulator n=1 Tax=Streptomyces sp. NPDC008121 TaxID=3364809 RepID=UPI0036E66CB1
MAEALTGPTRRRRLTPERRRELLRVTAQLVGEVGYDQVTMAAVAQRGRCSTATLYRQWQSKPRLVISAWKELSGEHGHGLERVDTGSLRGDLMALVERLLADDAGGGAFISVPAVIVQDETVMEIAREILIDPLLKDLSALLDRAVDRGEIEAANPIVGLTHQVLLGTWLAQTIVHRTPATRELMETVVDLVLLPTLVVRYHPA